MEGTKEPPYVTRSVAMRNSDKEAILEAIILDSIASQTLARDTKELLAEPSSNANPDLTGHDNGGQASPNSQDGEPASAGLPKTPGGEPLSPVSQGASTSGGPPRTDVNNPLPPASPDGQRTEGVTPSPTPPTEEGNQPEEETHPPTDNDNESEEENDDVHHSLPVHNSFALLSPSNDKAVGQPTKAALERGKATPQEKASPTTQDGVTDRGTELAEDGPCTVLFRPAGQAKFTIQNRLRIASYVQKIVPGKTTAIRFNLARNVLAVDTEEAATRRTLLGTQKLGEMEVHAFTPVPTAQECGTIRGLNPRDSDAFLRDGLIADTPIVHLRRFGEGRCAELRFDGPRPRFVELFQVRFYVEPLKVRPTQCTACGRLGHVRSACTMPTACPTCPQKHPRGECPRAANPKCPNCGYLHRATDKRCPAYQRARLEETIFRGTGCTRPEARKHAVAFAEDQKRRPQAQDRREEVRTPRPLSCAAWMHPSLTTFLLTRHPSEESRREFPFLTDSNPLAAPPAPFQRGPARAATQGPTPQPTGSAAHTAPDQSPQPTGNAPRSTTPPAAPEQRQQPTRIEDQDRQTEQNQQTQPEERISQRKEQSTRQSPQAYKETFGPARTSKRQRKRQRQAERHQNKSAPAAQTDGEADVNKPRQPPPPPSPAEQEAQQRPHPPLHPEDEASAARRLQQQLPPSLPQAEWTGPSLPHESVWTGGGLLPSSNGAPPPPFPLPPAAAGESPWCDGQRPPIHPLEQLLVVTLHQIDHLLRVIGPALVQYSHLQSTLPADSPVLTLNRHHTFPPMSHYASTA